MIYNHKFDMITMSCCHCQCSNHRSGICITVFMILLDRMWKELCMNFSKDFLYISIVRHDSGTYELKVSPAQHYETLNHKCAKLKIQTGSDQVQVNFYILVTIKNGIMEFIDTTKWNSSLFMKNVTFESYHN